MPSCPVCSAPVSRRGRTGPIPLYCSAACKAAAHRASVQRRRLASLVGQRCEWCSTQLPAVRRRRFCSSTCAAALRWNRERGPKPPCDWCGAYLPPHHTRFCSKQCAWARADYIRRQAGRTTYDLRRLIDRRAIGVRDGWRCQICASKLRLLDLDPRHEFTIDHIVPFSRGGTDDPSNLRTACRSCNSRRQADELFDAREQRASVG